MGARGEALAKTFEDKSAEATAAFEKLTDADWRKVTSAEQWPVGVVVHHIAWGHEVISGMIKAVASAQPLAKMSMDDLNAINAKNAQDWAGGGRSETIGLHKKNAAAAASIVRGINDADFDRKAIVLTGMPERSAADLTAGLLVGHVDEHLASIRATL